MGRRDGGGRRSALTKAKISQKHPAKNLEKGKPEEKKYPLKKESSKVAERTERKSVRLCINVEKNKVQR